MGLGTDGPGTPSAAESRPGVVVESLAFCVRPLFPKRKVAGLHSWLVSDLLDIPWKLRSGYYKGVGLRAALWDTTELCIGELSPDEQQRLAETGGAVRRAWRVWRGLTPKDRADAAARLQVASECHDKTLGDICDAHGVNVNFGFCIRDGRIYRTVFGLLLSLYHGFLVDMIALRERVKERLHFVVT